MSLCRNPFSCPVHKHLAEKCCSPLLTQLLLSSLPWIFDFDKDCRVFPSQHIRLQKGVLRLFVQMILLSCFSREEGRILKGFVPVRLLYFQCSIQRVLEIMKLKIKMEKMKMDDKAVRRQWQLCFIL